jgi:hypothetical protein
VRKRMREVAILVFEGQLIAVCGSTGRPSQLAASPSCYGPGRVLGLSLGASSPPRSMTSRTCHR